MPRNIDPAVGGLENVALYNIDDLEAVAREAVHNREGESAACHQIIDTHVAALVEKLDTETGRRHETDETQLPCDLANTTAGLLLQAS